jgi:hypothetical protein
MTQSKRYYPPHPILFVMDFSNDAVEIPEYKPESVTSSNESCVSVRTVADVDGEVTVFLSDGLPPGAQSDARPVFSGSIRTPSGRLALVTSENEKLVECDFGADKVGVRIFVDDEDYPTTIWVVVRQGGAVSNGQGL